MAAIYSATQSIPVTVKQECEECKIKDNIILYSTGCPKCKVLKKKLDSANIDYELISDVDIMQEKGFASTPVLEVNGHCMSFVEANTWVKEHIGHER